MAGSAQLLCVTLCYRSERGKPVVRSDLADSGCVCV
jgi:hypothetical protein